MKLCTIFERKEGYLYTLSSVCRGLQYLLAKDLLLPSADDMCSSRSCCRVCKPPQDSSTTGMSEASKLPTNHPSSFNQQQEEHRQVGHCHRGLEMEFTEAQHTSPSYNVGDRQEHDDPPRAAPVCSLQKTSQDSSHSFPELCSDPIIGLGRRAEFRPRDRHREIELESTRASLPVKRAWPWSLYVKTRRITRH